VCWETSVEVWGIVCGETGVEFLVKLFRETCVGL